MLKVLFDLFIRFVGVEPDPEERPDDLPPGFALMPLPNGRFGLLCDGEIPVVPLHGGWSRVAAVDAARELDWAAKRQMAGLN